MKTTFYSLMKELSTLLDEANNKAKNNLNSCCYEERGRGQLDVALDLKRIVDKYSAHLVLRS